MQDCIPRQTFSNQLEFTIHGLEEFDISRSPSPHKELPRVEDDNVTTELLLHKEDQETVDISKGVENHTDEQLAKLLKNSLKEREFLEESSSLLQDLKAMKEEAWAKRKARKLRRDMKRVQFQEDYNAPPFCRSCCVGLGRNNNSKNETLFSIMKNKGNFGVREENETSSSSSSSGESNEGVRPVRVRSTHRPIVHIHSINMFQNIIPRAILEKRSCQLQTFMPFNTPLVKLLAEIG